MQGVSAMSRIDVISPSELERLASHHSAACLSAYLPTTPGGAAADHDRLELKQLVASGLAALAEQGVPDDALDAIRRHAEAISNDPELWRSLSSGLAVLLSPGARLIYHLTPVAEPSVAVGRRFRVAPLLARTAAEGMVHVLDLSQGSARVLAVPGDQPPLELHIPGMPSDAATAVGEEALSAHTDDSVVQDREGRKVRLRQYAEQIDRALSEALVGYDIPLILAAPESLQSIYRSVNTSRNMLDEGLGASGGRRSDDEFAAAAREVAARWNGDRMAALAEQFSDLEQIGRVTGDLHAVARAATMGAIDTLYLDPDYEVAGTVNAGTGALEYGRSEDLAHEALPTEVRVLDGGIVDEIVRRTIATRGRVLAASRDLLPNRYGAVAVLRFH